MGGAFCILDVKMMYAFLCASVQYHGGKSFLLFFQVGIKLSFEHTGEMLRLNSGHILAGLLTKSMLTQEWKMHFSFIYTSSVTQYTIAFVLKSIEAKIIHKYIILKSEIGQGFFVLFF